MDREILGELAGKSTGDSAIGEGLDHQKHIGRAAAAQASDGIEEFFFDGVNLANARKNRLGQFTILRGGIGTRRVGCGGSADDGSGVRHGANDPGAGSEVLEGFEGKPGGNRDEEFVF